MGTVLFGMIEANLKQQGNIIWDSDIMIAKAASKENYNIYNNRQQKCPQL